MTHTVRLAEVAEINPKTVMPSGTVGDTVFDFLPMADVSEEGLVSVSAQRPYSEVQKGFTAFQNGDLLVAKITPCFENNKIAQAIISTKIGFGSTEFHVIRCHSNVLHAPYLLHLIRSDVVRAEGKRRMTGSAGQQRVPKTFFEELSIPLPPLEEQKRIAAILDQADDLRRKRQHAIDRLNQLGQAIFYEMFESEIASPNRTALGDLVEGFRYGTSNKSSDSGYPTLRIPNVVRGEIDSSDLKTVPLDDAEFKRLKLSDGDVLFVRTNGNPDYVGRSAVFTLSQANSARFESADWAYASYLIRARPRQSVLNPWFLQAYLSHPRGKRSLKERSKTSAGQYNINTEGLGSIPIPIAPTHKQISFAKKIEDMGPIMRPLLVAAQDADSLFASLQHRAFAGEL